MAPSVHSENRDKVQAQAESQHRTSILEIDNLSFSYAGPEHAVIDGLSLNVDFGEFAAIVGRSGCGKTTMINLIAGYQAPYSGSCFLNGRTIEEPSPERIPVFQADALLPWLNAIDNVRLYDLLRSGKSHENYHCAIDWLKAVGLEEYASFFPNTMSEGMKKRVELARALYARPRIVLADEPFAHLDADTASALQALLHEIWQRERISIILVTHSVREALFLASRIHVLKPSRPSSLSHSITNPIHGVEDADRHIPSQYFSLVDSIRSGLRHASQ